MVRKLRFELTIPDLERTSHGAVYRDTSSRLNGETIQLSRTATDDEERKLRGKLIRRRSNGRGHVRNTRIGIRDDDTGRVRERGRPVRGNGGIVRIRTDDVVGRNARAVVQLDSARDVRAIVEQHISHDVLAAGQDVGRRCRRAGRRLDEIGGDTHIGQDDRRKDDECANEEFHIVFVVEFSCG